MHGKSVSNVMEKSWKKSCKSHGMSWNLVLKIVYTCRTTAVVCITKNQIQSSPNQSTSLCSNDLTESQTASSSGVAGMFWQRSFFLNYWGYALDAFASVTDLILHWPSTFHRAVADTLCWSWVTLGVFRLWSLPGANAAVC